MPMSEEQSALRYAVRPRVVIKYTGQLGLVLAALTVVPLLVALGYGQSGTAERYAAVIVVLLLGSVPASRLPRPSRVQTNEGLVATALVFVLSPIIMTWPLMADGLGWLDALFEAVSGITTTGLSTVASVQARSPAFLFARSWLQWYGGLGFVVLSVALMAGSGIAWRRVIEQGAAAEGIVTTTWIHARRVLVVYLALTAAGIAVLLCLPVDPLDAVTHTLSAVSTGGFSTRDASLAAWRGTAVPWVVSALSLCGALPLTLWYAAFVQGPRTLRTDPEPRLLLLAVVAVAAVLSVTLGRTMPWSDALRQGVLLGISAQTTTGFSSLPVASLGAAAKGVLVLAMATGGCVGSTAGGVKLLRVLIVSKVTALAIRRTGMPEHAVAQVRLAGSPLEPESIERALLLVLLFVLLSLLSWLAFLAFGHAPLDALFEVTSAMGTVGLSTGVTGPGLEPALKGVLCVDMLAGRLEIVALLVLLYPGTWWGKKVQAA